MYTGTVAGPTTILVVASKLSASTQTIEIDFTQAIEGFPKAKGERHSTSSVEVTLGGLALDIRNAYQTTYSGVTYLLLASKQTDADADSNGAKVSATASWIANKTAVPGRIVSITVYGNSGASTSAVYYLDAFNASKAEALASSTTTVTGLTTGTLVYTAPEESDLRFFNLTTTTAANGQVTKIVIEYEVDGNEQPASSPAALQFTNVAEGEDRQHIEGAGAWVWLDATALGITDSNKAEYEVEVTTTGQAPAIAGYEIDIIRNGGARCYVRFASAEFAATTTINVSVTHNGVVYQGTIVFAGNELA